MDTWVRRSHETEYHTVVLQETLRRTYLVERYAKELGFLVLINSQEYRELERAEAGYKGLIVMVNVIERIRNEHKKA